MDHNIGLPGIIFGAVLLGAFATAIFDLYLAFIQPRIFKTPFTGFSMFGRWVGHLAKGRFFHDSVAAAGPVPYEKPIGWIGHYAVGILFAAILIILWPQFLAMPTLAPALVVGIGSVLAPFCVMQPAFGMGLFASKTPNPWAVRIRALASHFVFGLCLYAAPALIAFILA